MPRVDRLGRPRRRWAQDTKMGLGGRLESSRKPGVSEYSRPPGVAEGESPGLKETKTVYYKEDRTQPGVNEGEGKKRASKTLHAREPKRREGEKERRRFRPEAKMAGRRVRGRKQTDRQACALPVGPYPPNNVVSNAERFPRSMPAARPGGSSQASQASTYPSQAAMPPTACVRPPRLRHADRKG